MLKLLKNGQTSVILRLKLLSTVTGGGLTGLTSSSTGLIVATIVDNESATTRYRAGSSEIETITTLGTFAAPTSGKCRFKEVDATNHPGLYEIQLADARWAVSSAKSLIVSVIGATNLVETDAEIQLNSIDLFDAVRAGLTALPNAAAEAAGGLYTRGTGTGQINQPGNGSIDSNMIAVSGDITAADNAESFFDGTGYAGTNNVIPTVTIVNGLGANVITAASLAADAITAAKIADGAIDAATFAAGAINAAAIAADAITDAKVAADVTIASVTGAVGSVATGGITAASFAADSITAAKLAADVTTELQAGLATAAALVTVQTSVDDLPTNAELATALGTADDAVLAQVALVKAVTDKLDDTLEDDGGTFRFTTNALEQAPSSGGAAPTVEEIRTEMDDNSTKLANLDAPISTVTTQSSFNAAMSFLAAAIAALPDDVKVKVVEALTSAVDDSIPADGDRPSIAQAAYITTQFLLERAVLGTTMTVRKPDGSTDLLTMTLDDATAPTSVTRAT